MSDSIQRADLTMLEEQIQKMQSAYEHAAKTTKIINKAQKRLQGQDGRRAVQIKNALHEQDKRSQELSSDLTNLKDGLVWVKDLMYYADQEAARQLGAEDTGEWDSNRRGFEEAREELHKNDNRNKEETPVVIVLNGDEYVPDGTIPKADDGALNQHDTGRVANGMRGYENTGYNYQGNDYSDFSVLDGFDPDACCVNQNNIDHPASGKLCVSVAQMILHKIKTGETTDPRSTWGPNGTKYPENYTRTIEDPAVYQDQPSILREIFNQVVNNNNPVMVRMQGHSVTVIGIRNGTTADTLTIDDVLVVDPATGKVCTFREACRHNGRKEAFTNGPDDYWLRIPA